jgi:hypothetical protein
MSEDEREWKASVYEQFVADAGVKRRAWTLAENARGEDDPEVTLLDVECARPYLRKCLTNMSVNELADLGAEGAAALWARGAIGACRYRHRQSHHAEASATRSLKQRPKRGA